MTCPRSCQDFNPGSESRAMDLGQRMVRLVKMFFPPPNPSPLLKAAAKCYSWVKTLLPFKWK